MINIPETYDKFGTGRLWKVATTNYPVDRLLLPIKNVLEVGLGLGDGSKHLGPSILHKLSILRQVAYTV